MYTKVDIDLHPDTSDQQQMGRLEMRSRRYRHFVHHLATVRTLVILTSLCCSMFMTFSIVFYLRANAVSSLYSHWSESMLDEKPAIPDITWTAPVTVRRGLVKVDKEIVYADFDYLTPKTLTHRNRTYAKNVQVLFRLPKKTSISALLLIFHGCGRSANNWFHTIERQRIIGAAIDLGYGCLAFQASDQDSRCWSSDIDIYDNPDVKRVFEGLTGFFDEYPKLKKLPLFTFGASSGGIFSSVFAVNRRFRIHGQILFISIISPEIVSRYIKAKDYPPTAWIYMPRDIEFASEERINASIEVFIEKKIPYKCYDIQPTPLTPTTFHDRIPTISLQCSQYIFYRFQQNTWLADDNTLLYNPRRKTTWKSFLLSEPANTTDPSTICDNLVEHEDLLPDFLSTLYAEHEISFERSYEALQWHLETYNNRQ